MLNDSQDGSFIGMNAHKSQQTVPKNAVNQQQQSAREARLLEDLNERDKEILRLTMELTESSRRINELEHTISDLEADIEELRREKELLLNEMLKTTS